MEQLGAALRALRGKLPDRLLGEAPGEPHRAGAGCCAGLDSWGRSCVLCGSGREGDTFSRGRDSAGGGSQDVSTA